MTEKLPAQVPFMITMAQKKRLRSMGFDAALAVAPAMPTETPPDRRLNFAVIQGGKE